MYDTTDEDLDSGADQSSGSQSTPLQMQIPIIELLKVSCYCLTVICHTFFQSCCCCNVYIQPKHARECQSIMPSC